MSPEMKSFLQKLYDTVKRIGELLPTYSKPLMPEMPRTPAPTVQGPMLLTKLAKGIEKMEDFVPPGGKYRDGRVSINGSLSFRNNNPGNCRFSSVGYMPIYGLVREDRTTASPGKRGFAIFKDYNTGFLYLTNLIKEKARRHPTWTLLQFIGDEREGWAPASDNNAPKIYAGYLANFMGVDVHTFTIGRVL